MADQSVIDASAVAAVVFGEPDAPVVSSLTDGLELLAPDLLPTELANVCVKKVRREPPRADDLIRMHAASANFKVELVSVNHSAAVMLALRHRLTAYDACYLWLALDLGIGLVTLDRELLRAFREAASH